MQIRYHCNRGTSPSEFFEDYAEAKLEKVERLPFGLLKVDIATEKEGPFYTVEICVLGHKEVRASASTDDLMESLDRAVDKVLSQITKLKLAHHDSRREKRKTRQRQKEKLMENNGFVGDLEKAA